MTRLEIRYIEIWLVLLLELQNVQGSQSVDLVNVYVSKIDGNDRNKCGASDSPCRTLKLGFDNLLNGGQVFVDSRETQENPYSCDSTGGHLLVEKGFTMNTYPGQSTYPRISCTKGITVQCNPKNISIKGILFTNTTIVLKDTTAVFNDCIFKESSPSIKVKVSKHVIEYVLSVDKCLFRGNQGCIHIKSKNGQCNAVTLNVLNVVFEENTVLLDDQEPQGIVSVRSKLNCNRETRVSSHWKNVTVRNNRQMNSVHCFGQPCATTSHLSSSFFEVHAYTASLSFWRIGSQNNTDLRFLMINSSSHSNLSVGYSDFTGHCLTNETGAVFYITSAETEREMNDEVHTRIEIQSSDLWINTASSGGTLQINARQAVHLTIINSSIISSNGTITGCAVCVGKTNYRKDLPRKLFVLLYGFNILFSGSPCHFQNKTYCFSRRRGVVHLGATESLQAHIQNSSFSSNANFYQPTLLFEHQDSLHTNGTFKVVILDTKFDKNKSPNFGAILKIVVRHMKESSLTIMNSVFTGNNGVVLHTSDLKTIHINNVICENTGARGVCFKFFNGPYQRKPSIRIINSVFSRNVNSPLTIFQKRIIHTDILIKNSSFHNNYDNVIPIHEPILISISFSKTHLVYGKIGIHQVKFTSNAVSNSELLSFNIYTNYPGNVSVLMHNCTFKDNKQQHRNNGSLVSKLIYISMPFDKQFAANKCALVYKYLNYFHLQNVRFENNTCYSSLIYINNGKTTFIQCVFEDNFSHEPTVSAYVFVEHGSASIELRNTSFIQSTVRMPKRNRTYYRKKNLPAFIKLPYLMPFLYYGAKGPLIVSHSSFILNAAELSTRIFIISNGKYFDMDNNTNLLCPVGSFIDIENSSHVVPAVCSRTNCSQNIIRVAYVCRRCSYGLYSLLRGHYQGTKKNYIECFKCPFGGDCSHNIQSKWTFWGYKTVLDPPQLKFTRCLERYCNYPKTDENHSLYNYCNGNRTGVLCGSCKKGFTESMFNHQCRPQHECKDSWFWLVVVVYALAMSLYIMYQPSLVLFLVKKVLWFTNVRENDSHDQHHEHGYSKIIFFHYQIAILYSINPEILVQKYKAIFALVSLYNFEVKQADSSSGCPFPGLNAVTKEVFRAFQVFAAMAMVVVIYMLYWLTCLLTRRTRPYFAPYMAAIVEILLLGYERLAHTSLELLDCVRLTTNGRTEWRLFIDGNITCWVHWWQYALIAYNIIFVVPFLVVLFIGTTKLRQQQITALQFVAACFVPLLFLIFWIYKSLSKACQTCKTGYNEMRKTLLDVIQGPFKPPSNQSRGTLYWESVLTGRRLMFLCLRFLISSPMFRLLPMTLLSVGVLVHEVVVLPYKDNKANALSLLTLSINVVLATVNLCKSTLYSFGIFPEGRAELHFQRLEVLEIVFLCVVPGIISVLIVAAITAQIVRLIIKRYRYANPLSESTFNNSQNLFNKTDEDWNDDVTQRLICPVDENNDTDLPNDQ